MDSYILLTLMTKNEEEIIITGKKVTVLEDELVYNENDDMAVDTQESKYEDDDDVYDLETLEELKKIMQEHINDLSLPIGEYMSLNKIQKCVLTLLKYNY